MDSNKKRLKCQNVKNVDVKLNSIEVLTAGNVAELVNGILEFLLYQRRQIPFVYKTYKYYVEKWAEVKDTASLQESFAYYQLQNQRSKARETKDSISNMRELIRNAFKYNDVRSLRFLFGSNVWMPKESYTIHIPHAAIRRKHFCEHHAIPSFHLNQTFLALLTCEQLYSVFSSEINVTNLFLEIELMACIEEELPRLEGGKLFPKAVLNQLPRSCKNVHLHLLHDSGLTSDISLTCCKDLTIYEDLALLDLSAEDKSVDVGNQKTEQNCGWWQSDIVIRGFLTPKRKDFNLWTS